MNESLEFPALHSSPINAQLLHIVLITDRPLLALSFQSLGRTDLKVTRLTSTLNIKLFQPPADAGVLIVIDMALDSSDILQLSYQLHSRWPFIFISGLVCCPHTVLPWQLHQFLGSGISSFLDLYTPPSLLVCLFQRISKGETILHIALTEDYLLSSDHAYRNHASLLIGTTEFRWVTETNASLLFLLTQGYSDIEIGKQLNLSRHTIKHNIERLREIVGARNRTALAAWAGSNGFTQTGFASELQRPK